MEEGIQLLTYYQKTLLSFLADCAYQSVLILKDRYNLKMLIKWRRLIKKIEVNFEIPSYYNTMWDYSFTNNSCIKNEIPFLDLKAYCYSILRELIEFSKVSVKSIDSNVSSNGVSQAMHETVYHTLIDQFGFNYTSYCLDYPIPINISDFLIFNGLVCTTSDIGEEIWFYPNNYNEKTNSYVSSINRCEAEGLFYIGGVKLLEEIINFTKLSLYDI